MPATLARPSRPTAAAAVARDRRPAPLRRFGARLLGLVAALLLVGSSALFLARFVPARLVPVAPDTWAMVTAFTDLAAPACALAVVLAVASAALDRRRAGVVLAVLCVAATLVLALPLLPRWTGSPAGAGHAPFTVLALNARLGQADPVVLADIARAADLVVLTEVTAPQAEALAAAGLTDRLPHRNAGRLPQRGAGGTAVYSRFPLTSTRPLTSDLDNQAWFCQVDLPGASSPLTVVAVHPTRPRLGGSHWLPEQESLRAALPTRGTRLLAGDFNAVAFHPTQRALARDGWRSAVDEAGAGWVPTYPADSDRLPPVIDIDHVLVAGGLQATHARSVRVPGTDHLGLLVTVERTPSS